jgi:hypothetical protein
MAAELMQKRFRSDTESKVRLGSSCGFQLCLVRPSIIALGPQYNTKARGNETVHVLNFLKKR